jgi:hypothetical protein
MKNQTIAISYNDFAYGLGKQSRLMRESSLVWHMEYAKADQATRADRRHDWVVNYMAGNLDIKQDVAERILSKSRDERTKVQQASYLRASNQFKYHIIRPETVKPSTTTTTSTVSKQIDVVEQALALVESLSKAQQAKFFARVSRK